MKYLALFVLYFVQVFCAKFPSNIQLCHKSDPNFNECVTKNIGDAISKLAEGNKTLGIPKLEPFFIQEMDIGGTQGGSVSLNQYYSNIYLHGISKSYAKSFELDKDPKKCHIKIKMLTPVSRMEADYKMSGQVIVFPINGHGKCNVTLTELEAVHDITCVRQVKKGKTFMHITDYKFTMNPTKVSFHFENILPGNAELSKQLADTIDENSLNIFNDVKGAFEKSQSIIHQNVVTNIFDRVPESDIFLE